MDTDQGNRRPSFTLGLSLAGGVSAGAYVAGAVDFVVEALDAFEKAKDAGDPAAPPHDVLVKTVCGASAGALTAAALGAALRYDFPPVSAASDRARATTNPLYDSWVNMTTAENLLGTEDRGDPTLKSLLDSTPLENVAKKAISFGEGHAQCRRTWVANPLHVAFTVTNLRGVPFAFGGPGGAHGLRMRMHADVMRFAIFGLGVDPPETPQADEIQLTFPPNPLDKWMEWEPTFARAALASAAFPALLAGRKLERPFADYDHIKVLLPAGGGRSASAQALIPAWDPAPSQPPGDPPYKFDAADGGIMDNDPIDIAREILNDRDITISNPRNGNEASRAVLMIDPMTGDGAGHPVEFKATGLFSNLAALFPALQNQARFRPVEIALAAREDIYSRFLIAPLKEGPHGSESSRFVAGASCGGFGGYLSEAFRKHDYLLGRQNAQRFLREKLVLPIDNPLFDRWRSKPALVNRYRSGNNELPIIPLIGCLHPDEYQEPIPAWPAQQADLKPLRRHLDARLDLVWAKAMQQWKPPTLTGRLIKCLINGLWNWSGRNTLQKSAIRWLKQGLQHHGLG